MEGNEDALRGLLRDRLKGAGAAQLTQLFDAAFPVMPILTTKRYAGDATLQAERDLDQLSLLSACELRAVQVPQSRAVSLKLESDLEDPTKRPFLFGASE